KPEAPLRRKATGSGDPKPRYSKLLRQIRSLPRGPIWSRLASVRLLRSYILKLHLVPFLLGFGVVTFILVMDVLFDYLDLVVNRGVPVGIVLQLYLLSLGYIVALSVPCAVLVASLMTFGRLSQDNEITALKANGVHLGSILVGPLLAAALLSAGLTVFN